MTSIFNIPKPNKLIHLGLGLILALLFSHVWAFFTGFGLTFHALLFVLNIALGFYYRLEIRKYLSETFGGLSQFPFAYKLLLVVITLLILAKSASTGVVLDNENYYIQTIKWLNEYGYVDGLANLHLFFGQTSGWHVLQSAFSFHFVNIDFNDLGGFLLLMLNVYALKKIKSSRDTMIFGLPVLNFLLLEFTIVPSPDFGVIFCSILVVFYFFRSYSKPEPCDVLIILLLFMSAMLIKITALGLIVFPIALLFRLKNFSTQFYFKLLMIALGFSLLWVGKNLIITGYPLFPSVALSELFTLDHQIPTELYNYSLRKEKLLEFFVSVQELESLSTLDLIWQWLTHSKIGMVFNTLLLVLLILAPILISRVKSNAKHWWLYGSFCFQIVFLAFTSPQYRFMLHYIVIFGLLCFSFLIKTPKLKLTVLFLSQAIVLWFIIYPLRYNTMTSKGYQLDSLGFQLKNVIYPGPNSSITSAYQTKTLGNLKYQSPVEEVYFWSNGDGELPCVNGIQIKYLTQKTEYRPQLRDSTDLSKGFYAKKIKD